MALFKQFARSYRIYDNDYTLNDNITLACWIYGTHNTRDQHVAGMAHFGYAIYLKTIDSFSYLAARIGDTEIVDTEKISDREWFHAALTWDGELFKLYKNGKLIKLTIAKITYGTKKYDSNIWLFHDTTGGNSTHLGINLLTIWGSELSLANIIELANFGDPGLFNIDDIILGDFLDFIDYRHVFGSKEPQIINIDIVRAVFSPFPNGLVPFNVPFIDISSSSMSSSSDSSSSDSSFSSLSSSSESTLTSSSSSISSESTLTSSTSSTSSPSSESTLTSSTSSPSSLSSMSSLSSTSSTSPTSLSSESSQTTSVSSISSLSTEILSSHSSFTTSESSISSVSSPSNSSQSEPAASNDLAGWFTADTIVGLSDGDTVSTWEDQSPSASNAVLNNGTPRYRENHFANGQPAVDFNQSTGALIAPYVSNWDSPTGEITLAALVKITSEVDIARAITSLNNNFGSSSWSSIRLGLFARNPAGSNAVQGVGNGASGSFLTFGINLNEWYFVLIEMLITSPSLIMFDGETQVDSAEVGSASPASNWNLAIGGKSGTGFGNFSGFLAEIMFWKRKLSNNEKTQTWQYIEDKYGINI